MIEDDVPMLDIPRPCPMAWSSMCGEGAARTCERCQRAVHDFSILSATQIQSLLSDPSERVCARMDWKAVQRLGSGPLKALALSTMLTTVGVVSAAQPTETSTIHLAAIRGVVRAGDQPVPDFEVWAKHEGRGKGTATRTDEHGAFSFADLTPGLYVISFVSHKSDPQSADVAVEVCKGTTVVLDTIAKDYSGVLGEVIATGPRAGAIAGRVSSQKIDDGISGATVNLLRPDDGLRKAAQTDAFGRYTFSGLAPGHYEITGAAKGFVTRSIGFDLKAKPHMTYSSPGPNSIDPENLAGDIALCSRHATE
ncbi:MAG TPA: carboxypeptidase-like regulatory domain-containing protein [Steroidobacteraceae bacterium]